MHPCFCRCCVVVPRSTPARRCLAPISATAAKHPRPLRSADLRTTVSRACKALRLPSTGGERGQCLAPISATAAEHTAPSAWDGVSLSLLRCLILCDRSHFLFRRGANALVLHRLLHDLTGRCVLRTARAVGRSRYYQLACQKPRAFLALSRLLAVRDPRSGSSRRRYSAASARGLLGRFRRGFCVDVPGDSCFSGALSR